jgi:hypothetical protein
MEEFVLKQIQDRQYFIGKQNRDNEYHKFTNARNGWARLSSGVFLATPGSKFGGGRKYPFNYVLFNGASKYTPNPYGFGSVQPWEGVREIEGAYDTSDPDFGLVPMPGMPSVKVKDLNRGSIKKATVQIKANSRRQFEIIEELYLRLGYTMLLEWGWSTYVDSSGINDVRLGDIINEFFENDIDPRGDNYWLDKIREQRNNSSGNYDAMWARVANFSWKFNNDGTYDITLIMFSKGDIIESLRLVPSGPISNAIQIRQPPTSPFMDTALKVLGFSEDYLFQGIEKFEFVTYPVSSGYSPYDYFDQSDIRDKLTEYLWYITWFGAISYNGTKEILISPDKTTSTTTRWLYDQHITRYKPFNLPFRKHGDLFGGYNNSSKKKSTDVGIDSITHARDVGGVWTPKTQVITVYDGWNPHNDIVETYANIKAYKQAMDDQPSNRKYNPFNDEMVQSYIRLEHLLEAIQQFCIPYETSTNSNIININKGPIPLFFPPQANKLHGFIYQGNKNNRIFSLKPKTVILQNRDINFNYISPRDMDNDGFCWAYVGGDNMDGVGDEEITTNDQDPPESQKMSYIKGENLFISTTYIKDLIPLPKNDLGQVNLNLFNFLKDICQEINEALGNVNNLEPVIDETTNTLYLRDTMNFPGRQELYKKLGMVNPDLVANEEYYQPIQVYGYRNDNGGIPQASFVRDIDLNTKISKELTSIITAGATAQGFAPSIEATAFAKWNIGKIDRFLENLTYKTSGGSKKTPKSWEERLEDKLYVAGERYIQEVADCSMIFGYNPGSMWTSVYLPGYTPETKEPLRFSEEQQSQNISFFTNYYQYLLAMYYKDKTVGSPTIGFLPFELSLTMDGLSGTKIYNKLNIDTSFLPENYPRALEFVVKGVEHTIKNNDWITKIDTIACPRASKDDVPRTTGINISGGT